LRKVFENSYEVIGGTITYGLMRGEYLLGPLPAPWKLWLIPHSGPRREPVFCNSETGVKTLEDPRLWELPADWERIEPQPGRTPDDPFFTRFHRNKRTGEVINSDPRMLPEELISRGIKVETFKLV